MNEGKEYPIQKIVTKKGTKMWTNGEGAEILVLILVLIFVGCGEGGVTRIGTKIRQLDLLFKVLGGKCS